LTSEAASLVQSAPIEVPAALHALRAWLVWRSEPNEGKKPSKVPYYFNGSRRNGEQGSADDRAQLVDFDTARAACDRGNYSGVGLALLPGLGITALDFDACVVDGKVDPRVEELIAGTYAELSPSGAGVRAFMLGELPDKKSYANDSQFGFEVFCRKGFVTVTGRTLDVCRMFEAENIVAAVTPQIQEFYSERFGVGAEPAAPVDDLNRAFTLHRVTDETIGDLRSAINGLSLARVEGYESWINIGQALASLKPTQYAAQALELWHAASARTTIAGQYNSEQVEEKWAGFSPTKISYVSIFEWAQADGWQNPGSVKGSAQNVTVDDLRREHQKKENERIGEGTDAMPVAELITLQSALDRFVFLADGSRVADRLQPHYDLALQDFKNTYAASKVTVKQKAKEGRDGSVIQPADKSAPVAELWNSSPHRRTVVSRTFKAGAPEVLNDPRGRLALNLWKPFDRSIVVDDLQGAGINLFLEQVEFLFGADAPRFLDWLAHIEQEPGILPHTAWLHVATQCGLGRNWLASVLTRVWAGSVAANFDLVSTLNSGFNERLSRKVLAVVDEIREGGRDTWTHSETMKRLINEEFRTINTKFGRLHEEYNSCRWLILSNHRSALPIEDGDRRIEVVITDAKPRSLEVYTQLYGALNDKRFIAAVATFLAQRDISKFNPGREAARTAAKAAVIETSMPPMALWCRQLVSHWPCDLISAADLLQVLEGNTFNRAVNPAHRRVIERAGIEALGKASKIDGQMLRLNIVRNVSRWKSAAPYEIAEHYREGAARIKSIVKAEGGSGEHYAPRDLLDLIALKEQER
jgi:hypothetical protein